MQYKNYWHMKEGGKHINEEVFKCTGCGTTTRPRDGWNGEPNPHQCKPGCPCRNEDWSPGRITDRYRDGYDRIRWGGGPAGADRVDRPGADLYRENYDRVFGREGAVS